MVCWRNRNLPQHEEDEIDFRSHANRHGYPSTCPPDYPDHYYDLPRRSRKRCAADSADLASCLRQLESECVRIRAELARRQVRTSANRQT